MPPPTTRASTARFAAIRSVVSPASVVPRRLSRARKTSDRRCPASALFQHAPACAEGPGFRSSTQVGHVGRLRSRASFGIRILRFGPHISQPAEQEAPSIRALHDRPFRSRVKSGVRSTRPTDLLDDVVLTGSDPVLPSSFKVGLAAQTAIAASALAAADLWRLRSAAPAIGQRRSCAMPRPNSAASAICASTGEPRPSRGTRSPVIYRCGDGGFVRLHTNFPASPRRHPRPSRLRP